MESLLYSARSNATPEPSRVQNCSEASIDHSHTEQPGWRAPCRALLPGSGLRQLKRNGFHSKLSVASRDNDDRSAGLSAIDVINRRLHALHHSFEYGKWRASNNSNTFDSGQTCTNITSAAWWNRKHSGDELPIGWTPTRYWHGLLPPSARTFESHCAESHQISSRFRHSSIYDQSLRTSCKCICAHDGHSLLARGEFFQIQILAKTSRAEQRNGQTSSTSTYSAGNSRQPS